MEWTPPRHLPILIQWILPCRASPQPSFYIYAEPAAQILPIRGKMVMPFWTGGAYETNLTLARMGILPFFWLTCFLVWRFMSHYFGQWHAAVAVFLLAICPVVLGHSALATTDAPFMAMFLSSVLALWALLQKPTRSTALLAGFIIGLGTLTKFTEIPFLLVTGGALLSDAWVMKRRFPVPWKLIGLGMLSLCLTIWAGYHFDHRDHPLSRIPVCQRPSPPRGDASK